MKATNMFILVMTLFFAFSCGEKKDEVKVLKKEVMDIHDEVMPEMGSLRSMKKQLLEKAETSDSAVASDLVLKAKGIEAANEDMMNWMRNFDPDFEGTKEEKLAYLKEQKQLISKVKETMHIALDEGKDALSQ